MNTKQFEFTPENLPYLYQSDFHNFRFNTKGFYLDTNGNQYHYDMPEPDYFSDFVPYSLNTNGNPCSIDEPTSRLYIHSERWGTVENRNQVKNDKSKKRANDRLIDLTPKLYIHSEKWGEEINDTIKPDDLFHNLSQCTVKVGGLKLELRNDVINDLYNAPLRKLEQSVLDAGWNTKCILFYIAELDLYKRILLTSNGNVNNINQSIYTGEILELLEVTNI